MAQTSPLERRSGFSILAGLTAHRAPVASPARETTPLEAPSAHARLASMVRALNPYVDRHLRRRD